MLADPSGALVDSSNDLENTLLAVVSEVLGASPSAGTTSRPSTPARSFSPDDQNVRSGVSVTATGTDTQGRTLVQVANAWDRWVSLVVSYSNDGSNYSTPTDENGPSVFPLNLLESKGPFDLIAPTKTLALHNGPPYARVKVFGFGFGGVATAFADPDFPYSVFPVAGDVVFNLALPLFEVITGTKDLNSAPIWSGSQDVGMEWIDATSMCMSSDGLEAALVGRTLMSAVKPLLKCAVLAPFEDRSLGAGLLAAAGVAVTEGVLLNVLVPLRVVFLASSIYEFGLSTTAVVNANVMEVFPLSDPTKISVTSISPSSGQQAGGTPVTITGTNFTNVQTVTVGGAALGSRTVVNSTQITGATPASSTAGAKDVVVTSSAGSATCAGCFTYNATVATVVVTPAGAAIAAAGGTQTFTAVAKDALGNTISGKTFVWASLNSSVATMNASSGVATALASGQVTVSATVDGVTGYSLLTVAVPGAMPVTLWNAVSGGAAQWLEAVWGTSASEVYVVGSAGTIVRYNGAVWSAMTSGTTQMLEGVWGTSSSATYAVGYSGTILRYNGTSWGAMTSGTASILFNVWGTSGSDIYTVGDGGAILHYNGTAWSAMTSGTSQRLLGVWGTSSSDVYAVGYSGTILHYSGATWSAMTSGTTNTLYDVWGTSSADIYAVGVGGTILHYNGTGWSAMTSGATDSLYGVWGTASSDLYAVGNGGTILRYNGTSWSRMTTGTTQRLYKVWGTSGSDVYAIGYAGTTLRGIRGASTAVAVTAADRFACAIKSGGAAYCWGYGAQGQLGNGTTSSSSTPTGVSGSLSFSTISASATYPTATQYVMGEACAIAASGTAYCWGSDQFGQLGNGLSSASSVPTTVSGGLVLSSVSVGEDHACGVTTTGSGYCWGRNYYGQLGNGTKTGDGSNSSPVQVSGSLAFSSISSGASNTCGITANGAAYCWGEGEHGELGNGTTLPPGGFSSSGQSTPVAVTGGFTFRSVSAASGYACGVTTANDAYCWGDNSNGQLGTSATLQACSTYQGTTYPCATSPVLVAGGLKFASISTFNDHTCGMTLTGTAYCWGNNSFGQLGTGDTVSRSAPVAVSGGLTFSSMSAGSLFTCGTTTAGAVYCWGKNDYGQLGNGLTTDSPIPVLAVIP